MNYLNINAYLVSCGFVTRLGKNNDSEYLEVDVVIDGSTFTLKHFYVDELIALPSFFLHDDNIKSGLAHILPLNSGKIAGICVTTQDSVSVNFEVPHLAFQDSLLRHISLLKKAITDKDWNESELIREFTANWSFLCEKGQLEFICASSSAEFESLSVMPPIPGKGSGFRGSFIGLSESSGELSDYSYIKSMLEEKGRKKAGYGFIVPLGKLTPPPSTKSNVKKWYLQTLKTISTSVQEQLFDSIKSVRSKEFWLIFNGETSSGKAWFGLKLSTSTKKFLPLAADTVSTWTLSPINVKIFNREAMLPRGGAQLSLYEKKVLLIGCGSVGGEIAHKISSAGLGEIHLIDPDTFSWDNIYRHVLSSYDVGYKKSMSLSVDLASKYPWIKSHHNTKRLLDYRDEAILKKYDLVIIAIGSPTHERIFSEFYREKVDLPPVINTWLEGYCVGGHATLHLPGKKGCLNCAYVDNSDFSRGLSSNLNFIDKNQNLTKNIAGCGDLFLPYSGIDASQTAVMASELAIKYLLGKVPESASVSWKGCADEAVENGIELTHRFYNFSESLTKIPLYHEGCDVCK